MPDSVILFLQKGWGGLIFGKFLFGDFCLGVSFVDFLWNLGVFSKKTRRWNRFAEDAIVGKRWHGQSRAAPEVDVNKLSTVDPAFDPSWLGKGEWFLGKRIEKGGNEKRGRLEPKEVFDFWRFWVSLFFHW